LLILIAKPLWQKAIKHNKQISLEKIHRFLSDEIWKKLGVEGIIYDDKPVNSRRSERVYFEIPDLYYKKRIQMVSFALNNIYKFVLYLEEQNYNYVEL